MAVATDEAASDLEAPERSFTVGRVKFDAANTTDPFLAATGDQLPLFTSDLDELYDSAIVEGVNDWSLRVESQFSTEHMHSEKFNLMRINIMLPDSYPKVRHWHTLRVFCANCRYGSEYIRALCSGSIRSCGSALALGR